MPMSDFLVEYDLSESQLAVARKLKQEADLKQLMNALADHAKFYAKLAAHSRRETAAQHVQEWHVRGLEPKRDGAEDRSAALLAWFSGLSVVQRQAALACEDPAWLRALMKMLRALDPDRDSLVDTRFSVVPSAATKAAVDGKKAKLACTRDPAIRCRRSHMLPDGSILRPQATAEEHAASQELLAGLRLVFGRTSNTDVVMPSSDLVKNPELFFKLLHSISAGCCMKRDYSGVGAAVRPDKKVGLPWQDAEWLWQSGSYVSLAAFCASQLEVLLMQSHALRNGATKSRSASTSLQFVETSNAWFDMPPHMRSKCIKHSAIRMLQQMAKSDRQAMFQQDADGGGIIPEVSQLFTTTRPEGFSAQIENSPAFAEAALSTRLSQECAEASSKLWARRVYSENFATECSEVSATMLMHVTAQAQGKIMRKKEKRQRQKAKRRQGGHPATAQDAREGAMVREGSAPAVMSRRGSHHQPSLTPEGPSAGATSDDQQHCAGDVPQDESGDDSDFGGETVRGIGADMFARDNSAPPIMMRPRWADLSSGSEGELPQWPPLFAQRGQQYMQVAPQQVFNTRAELTEQHGGTQPSAKEHHARGVPPSLGTLPREALEALLMEAASTHHDVQQRLERLVHLYSS
mmetsp:Transcript_20428/g.37221  ORF Transcript_20428/g.37221 Transcript_20428/m.37221 type:complete len:634 (-) Transcript_20428:131-2032(-)